MQHLFAIVGEPQAFHLHGFLAFGRRRPISVSTVPAGAGRSRQPYAHLLDLFPILAQHFLRPAVQDDPALVHDEQPVCQRHHPVQLVLDHDDGQPGRLPQPGHGRQHFRRRRRVEVRGGLVQDEHAGLHGEDGSDGDPLLLAAGQLVDIPPLEMSCVDQLQRSSDAFPDLGRRQRQVLGAEGDLVVDCQGAKLRFRVLLHDAHKRGKLRPGPSRPSACRRPGRSLPGSPR